MKRKRAAAAYSALAALFVCVVIFHFFIMDLDVLWAKVMRRLAL